MSENISVEAYENTDGTIDMYAYKDGEVVWSQMYSDGEMRYAAADFAGIAVQGIDPSEDGWISAHLGEPSGDLFASSDWYDGTDASMVTTETCGESGRRMVEAFLG